MIRRLPDQSVCANGTSRREFAKVVPMGTFPGFRPAITHRANSRVAVLSQRVRHPYRTATGELGFMSEDRNQNLPLFDRLGGRIFIALIAEKFSDRLFTDPWMDGLFGGVEVDGLKRGVTDLACELFSGASDSVRPVL